MKHCPLCRSARIHQSRRKGIVERMLLAIVFVRPLRCERCDSRFFRVSLTGNVNASRQGRRTEDATALFEASARRTYAGVLGPLSRVRGVPAGVTITISPVMSGN